jgi:regulator of protease activity HflC (stomatin/prohibitin superfamily)
VGYVILSGIVLLFAAIVLGVARSLRKSEDPESVRAAYIAMVATLVIAPLFLVVFTVVESFHTVRAGYVGVVYQFGNIVGQTEAGLVTTWPWQNVQEANVQVQRAQFADLEAFSAETQDVFIVATINYRVDPSTIQDLYRSVGPNYFEKLVPTRVNQLFKDETVKYQAVRIAPNREKIRRSVRERLAKELGQYSIQVEDLLIDNIKFSPEFTQAIEDKQIATQQAQAAQNRVREAKFKAQQLIEQAQGEAKAFLIKNRTLTPLVVQQNAIDKLNPNIEVLILPSNSNFLLPSQLLAGRGGTR